jgi:hypothetical protein
MSGTLLTHPEAHSRLVDDLKQVALKKDLTRWRKNIKVTRVL